MTETLQTPPARQRFHIWRTVTIICIVGFLALAIRACLSDDCSTRETELRTPNSGYIARSFETLCQGSFGPIVNFNKVIEVEAADTHERSQIFKSNTLNSNTRWTDDKHLAIEVGGFQEVGMSAHSAFGVQVTYRVPAKLKSVSNVSSYMSTKIGALCENGKLATTERERLQKNGDFLDAYQEDFFCWASANAVFDEN